LKLSNGVFPPGGERGAERSGNNLLMGYVFSEKVRTHYTTVEKVIK